MKEYFRRVWPILLPVICLIAGIIAIVFFFTGPWGKGQYDILAIGVILIILATTVMTIDIVSFIKGKKK